MRRHALTLAANPRQVAQLATMRRGGAIRAITFPSKRFAPHKTSMTKPGGIMATCKTWSFCEDPASGFTALLLCDDKMERCRVIYDAVKPSKGSLPNVEYDQSVTELWKRLGPTIAKHWSAERRM